MHPAKLAPCVCVFRKQGGHGESTLGSSPALVGSAQALATFNCVILGLLLCVWNGGDTYSSGVFVRLKLTCIKW